MQVTFRNQSFCCKLNLEVILILTLYLTVQTFKTLKKKPFEDIVEEGENALSQHFLLSPQCFVPYETGIIFRTAFELLPATLFKLDWPKTLNTPFSCKL